MAEIDLTTDRQLAVQTDNYELWLPKNQGPEESWGILLNENFDIIDAKFGTLGDQINSALAKERELESAISTEHIRVNNNIDRLDLHDGQLVSLDDRATAVEAEVEDARGEDSALGDRLRRINDDDGTPRTDLYLSNLKRLQWTMRTFTVSGTTAYHDVADLFLSGNKVSSDGTTIGVIAAGSTYNYGLVFTSDKEAVYNVDGERVICRTVKVGNALRITFETIKGTGVVFNAPGSHRIYNDIVIFYPEVVTPHDIPVTDKRRTFTESIMPANSDEFGSVKLGHNNGNDADTVDMFHASGEATPNTLLALDGQSHFPPSSIYISKGGTIDSTLANEFPSVLYSEGNDTYKTIADYIGASTAEVFAKVKAGDEGAQFSKTIAEVESEIDYAVGGVGSNATAITALNLASISGDSDLNDLIAVVSSAVTDEEARAQSAELVLSDRVDVNDSFRTSHGTDPDTHHSSTSANIDIIPKSITTQLAQVDTAVIQNLIVEVQTNINSEINIVDRFQDINAPSGEYTMSGEDIIHSYNEYGSPEIPAIDSNYGGGFVFHKGMTMASGEYGLMRYNPNTEEMEFCPDWTPMKLSNPEDPEYFDNNIFQTLGGTSSTKVVSDTSQSIDNVVGSMGGNGKVLVREGEYIGDVYLPNNTTLEGMGRSTYINGTVYISGEYNILTKVRAAHVHCISGCQYNQVLHNFIDGDLIDDGVVETNLLWGNL